MWFVEGLSVRYKRKRRDKNTLKAVGLSCGDVVAAVDWGMENYGWSIFGERGDWEFHLDSLRWKWGSWEDLDETVG